MLNNTGTIPLPKINTLLPVLNGKRKSSPTRKHNQSSKEGNLNIQEFTEDSLPMPMGSIASLRALARESVRNKGDKITKKAHKKNNKTRKARKRNLPRHSTKK